jgi:hypothetical protein
MATSYDWMIQNLKDSTQLLENLEPFLQKYNVKLLGLSPLLLDSTPPDSVSGWWRFGLTGPCIDVNDPDIEKKVEELRAEIKALGFKDVQIVECTCPPLVCNVEV